jgi:hypothetical protein
MPLRHLLFLMLLAISFTAAWSQSASPYSRYGFGFNRTASFSSNRGMAELSGGYSSIMSINAVNPASYADIGMTTLEVGANLDATYINTGDTVYRSINGSMSHLAFAFPAIKRKWGISVGLLPHSNLNYSFSQSFNDSIIGGYDFLYRGVGSLYNVYLGNGFRVSDFYFGVNTGFLFGKLDYNKVIAFPDSIPGFNTRNSTNMRVSGFVYNVGVMYKKRIVKKTDDNKMKQDIFFSAGVYGSGGVPVQAKTSSYWERFTFVQQGLISVVDTAGGEFDVKQTLKTPWHVGGGVMFGNEAYWQIGADFRYSDWKSFESPLGNNLSFNGWRMSLGGQIIPNGESRKLLPKVQYRAGVYYGKTELAYAGNRLDEIGTTIGIGIPVKRAFARINLNVEAGSRGFNLIGGISETYVRTNLAFILSDQWFIKRKFD